MTRPYPAPTDEPTNQPTDQPTNQPTDQPTNQPTDQPPAFWSRVRELFQAAESLSPADREELLRREDPAIRAEVESLLAAHDEAGSFLNRSVWDMASEKTFAGSAIGPYRITEQIGSGGMGSVFLGIRDDAQFTQRVAIKLVRGAAAGEALIRRFRQERQILAALEHPNIARLLDGGATADGLPYLVMEYVEGTPIDEYCRAQHCSIPDKLRLFLQLCDAVQYAHRNLIIHRDIKPANVLVTADGTPKLLDFGIAKLTSDQTLPDATVTRLMTPDYASPEQLLGEPVTTATDVYSLGVLLHEMLTGRRPFAGQTRTPHSEPPRPVVKSRDLETVVLTAMEVDPSRRYGSVEKLADDVRRYLNGHPVAARRASFVYRAWKFAWRNKLPVLAAAAVVVVTIVAFVATLRQKRIAERRFDEVRSLARSIVFELHDAIAELPGSTPARELLVRRALVYLDTLARESEDNTPLQLELAAAYSKIGDVQGLPYRANLGDTAGALSSYRKAVAIAEDVRARGEADESAVMLLADAHERVGLVEQRAANWQSAFDEHDRALQLRESLPPGPARDLSVARNWVAIGDCLYVGRIKRGVPRNAYESALRVLERIPREGPHRAELLKETGRANQRLGGYFTGLDRDLPRAIRHHDAALVALGELAALDRTNAVAQRNYADQIVMKATAQNMARDGAGALEGTRRAEQILLPLAAADPKNVEAQHDLAFVYEQMGTALYRLQRWDEAEAAVERGIAIREKLVAADPENREDVGGLSKLRGIQKQIRAAR
jgi:eukaryotic-like serine/threonine-protein kinase